MPGKQNERLIATLCADCNSAVGVYASISDLSISLVAAVFSYDGKECVRGKKKGLVSESRALGQLLAEELLAKGADELL